MANSPNLESLETVATLARRYPQVFPSEHAVRWLLRFRDKNGLADAVYTCGRKLLIDREAFERWLTKNRGK